MASTRKPHPEQAKPVVPDPAPAIEPDHPVVADDGHADDAAGDTSGGFAGALETAEAVAAEVAHEVVEKVEEAAGAVGHVVGDALHWVETIAVGDWHSMKAWTRQEIELARQGHSDITRSKLNP